jgi:1-deoxy-D-xylulose-5-phosphate synthase
MKAAEILSRSGIEAEVVNARFVKPIDEALLVELAGRIRNFVTIEDNVVQGGFGAAVLEALAKNNITNVAVKLHGLPDVFIDHGTPNELHHLLKLDPQGIADTTQEFLSSRRGKSEFELAEP